MDDNFTAWSWLAFAHTRCAYGFAFGLFAPLCKYALLRVPFVLRTIRHAHARCGCTQGQNDFCRRNALLGKTRIILAAGTYFLTILK